MTTVSAYPSVKNLGLHLASPAALAEFLTKRYPNERPWIRARHLEYISDTIVECAVGTPGYDRVMVFSPPQNGKSQLISRWGSTWMLACNPGMRIGIVSYEAEIARQWGFSVRNTLEDAVPELGITILEDSRAAHAWQTEQGGGIVTAGVGGPLTSRGLDVLIIDDPVKNAADAESALQQERNWRWFLSVARTRLRPGGRIFLVMTRWAKDDLAGKLLQAEAAGPEAEGYDNWLVLNFPAIAEKDDVLGRAEGEALWPEVFPLEWLERTRRASGEYVWSAMYQGRAVPRAGGLIKHVWWKYWVPRGTASYPNGRGTERVRDGYEPVLVEGVQVYPVEIPEEIDEVFQSWDCNHKSDVKAIVKGKEPDHVAGQVWGRKNLDLYLFDRFHARVGLSDTIQAVRDLSRRYPAAVRKIVEYTANGPDVMAKLHDEVGGFVPATPVGSKFSRLVGGTTEPDRHGRAIGMLADIEAGHFFIPHPAYRPWAAEFRQSMGDFPRAGRDEVDAASQAHKYCRVLGVRERDAAQVEAVKYGRPPLSTVEQQNAARRKWIEAERKPKKFNAWRILG